MYIKLLTKLITEGKWYYKIGDKITDYICPRIVAISIAQKNYLEMLDIQSDLDEFKLNTEIETYESYMH